jgi:F-type H+-transporting ATPase subunit epsilon
MADKLTLEVITPEKLALREVVDEIVVPGANGELGILPEHAPLISQLKTGVLSYRRGAERKQLFVSGGFLEVLPDKVSILADVAEKPEEIDLVRAQRAREHAEHTLNSRAEGPDFESAQLKLERALVRIQLAKGGN